MSDFYVKLLQNTACSHHVGTYCASRSTCLQVHLDVYIFNKSKRARGYLHCSTVTEHEQYARLLT